MTYWELKEQRTRDGLNVLKTLNVGQLVYWVEGMSNYDIGLIRYGIVTDIFHDAAIVSRLVQKEERYINGVPIMEFEETEWCKLPKGWSYDTRLYTETQTRELVEWMKNHSLCVDKPKTILAAYEAGILVTPDKIFQGRVEAIIDTTRGYKVVKKYPAYARTIPTSTSLKPDQICVSYDEAAVIIRLHMNELNRIAELTDEEWAAEQIDNTLNHYAILYGLCDEEKQRYRDYFMSMDNLFDVEVRIIGQRLEWKRTKNKKWGAVVL